MPQTQTSCPRCHQPVVVNLEQLFDMNVDPEAKQHLLSGAFNVVRCPNCGYEGNLPTPIVYHDPEKELLLTYFPPELGLPVNEQERLIGPNLNKVMNKLPIEKRKAYLLRPQNMLTLQTMIERILEADGITKDMIQAQQKRLNLIQRLLSSDETSMAQLIQEEDESLDEEFFALFNSLIEAALANGDENSARQLAAIQQKILPLTSFGHEYQSQAEETELAVKSLQEASKKGLTRESLLDLMVDAPTDTRLMALVSMARSGIDYNFLQILSDRIEKADGEEQAKLTDLREKLLSYTQELDQQIKLQTEQAQKLLDQIVQAENIEQTTAENFDRFNNFFVELLKTKLEEASAAQDSAMLEKLQRIVSVLQQASAPPGSELIETLLSAPDEPTRLSLLNQHSEEITPEFIQMFGGLVTEYEQKSQDPSLLQKLQETYSSVIKFSMQTNFNA